MSKVSVLRTYHSAVVSAWRQRDRELRRRNIDVTLASPHRWNEGGRPVDLDAGSDSFVEPIRTVGHHPYRFTYAPWTLARLLRRRWDVVDVHEEAASLAVGEVLVLRVLLRQKAPMLLYCAQNIEKRYPPPFRWIERWALRTAAGVYCCNEEAGRILRRKGFRGELRVIGLGVDVEHFAVAHQPGPGLRLGYVGRLEEHKGVHVLLDALTDLPHNITLTVAGAGPHAATLQKQTAEAGLADRVRFIDYVDHDDLPATYAGFDVLVVPSLPTASWKEQFGRVAVEAMAAGVPVVASDDGSLPEVVADGGVLVRPGDAAALAAVLGELAEDRGRLADLAERARRRAEHYSWASIAEQHAELYEAVRR